MTEKPKYFLTLLRNNNSTPHELFITKEGRQLVWFFRDGVEEWHVLGSYSRVPEPIEDELKEQRKSW